MRKTEADRAADPVLARVAVLERVKARRPPERVRTYPATDDGRPGLVTRTPSESGRLAPKDLQEWCDDREVGTFGGRVRLNDGEACAFAILGALRSGDPGTVREAVRKAGDGVDAFLRFAVSGVLQDWRGKAPAFALDVASTAVAEARRLGWDQRPRVRRRGPEPLSQVPGEKEVA